MWASNRSYILLHPHIPRSQEGSMVKEEMHETAKLCSQAKADDPQDLSPFAQASKGIPSHIFRESQVIV